MPSRPAPRDDGFDADTLDLRFSGEIWEWRGPSPFFFITIPDEASAALRGLSSVVSYGWGMIPVHVRIGSTSWTTSLFPKDRRYVIPIKDAVRATEHLAGGDVVSVEVAVRA